MCMPSFVFNWNIVLLSLFRPAQGLFAWKCFMNSVTDILVEMVGDGINFRKAAILDQVVNECATGVMSFVEINSRLSLQLLSPAPQQDHRHGHRQTWLVCHFL